VAEEREGQVLIVSRPALLTRKRAASCEPPIRSPGKFCLAGYYSAGRFLSTRGNQSEFERLVFAARSASRLGASHYTKNSVGRPTEIWYYALFFPVRLKERMPYSQNLKSARNTRFAGGEDPSIRWGQCTVFGIASRIQQVSDATAAIEPGNTLYPALLRIEQRGWIASKWASRKITAGESPILDLRRDASSSSRK